MLTQDSIRGPGCDEEPFSHPEALGWGSSRLSLFFCSYYDRGQAELKEQVNLLRKVADDELQRLGPVPGHGPPFLQRGVSPELGMKEGVLMA